MNMRDILCFTEEAQSLSEVVMTKSVHCEQGISVLFDNDIS